MPDQTQQKASGEDLIQRLAAAINAHALYPAEHPRARAALDGLLETLSATLRDSGQGAVELLVIGEDLVVDRQPHRQQSLHHIHLREALQRCGVEAVTFIKGLDNDECRALITALAERKQPASSPYLEIGRVELLLGETSIDEEDLSALEKDEEDGKDSRELERAVAEGGQQFAAVRRGEPLDLSKLRAVVEELVSALSRTTRLILPLATLRGHDEQTFLHSVNVSLLVLAQGRSLGVGGPALRELGLAALLHDLGKVDVPLEILRKPGRLNHEDWEVVMRHPELGAARLTATERSSPLAIIVAYEHHLRYDGRPSYPRLTEPRRPCLASRMTSIADTFDAICSTAPQRKAVPRDLALDVLRDGAGALLDPLLVERFHHLMTTRPPV